MSFWNMRMRSVCIGLLPFFFSFILPSALCAQAVSTAHVSGRVADPSGAIVLDAQIKLTDTDMGVACV